jgi:hypothetical protein
MSDPLHDPPRSAERPLSRHVRRHGKPSSRVLAAVIIAAFITGGIAIVAQSWWLFWLGSGVVLVSPVAGWIIQMMDDTVVDAGSPDEVPLAGNRGSAAEPSVAARP